MGLLEIGFFRRSRVGSCPSFAQAAVPGVGLAMPCGTLSSARRGNDRGGPKPLRGEKGRELWGLPGLTGLDLIRVRAADSLIRLLRRVADKCFEHDVCYVENPLTSRILMFHCIQKLWRKQTCSAPRFDFCQFDKNWRKATRILCFNNHVFARSSKQCVCVFGKGHSCSAMGGRHVGFTGADKQSGQFLTSRA